MDPDLARRRALSSPLRMRILRVCLHEARTNREIAERLHLDPATCLHHVRTLVDTGFLAAQAERRGARGAREIPYLATRLTWRANLGDEVPLLVNTFVDEVGQAEPGTVDFYRLGVKLTDEQWDLYWKRFAAIFEELAQTPADPAGRARSLFFAVHPDPQAD